MVTTPSFVQVAPDSTGKKIDNVQLVNSNSDTVQRQVITIADPANASQWANVDASGRLSVASPNVTLAISNPNIAVTTTQVLAANTSAVYRFIQNTTGTAAWMNFGSAAVVGTGLFIGAYGSYEMSPGTGNMDTRVINAISTSGTLAFAVLEGA